jgi:preprotein translocase subunit SecD
MPRSWWLKFSLLLFIIGLAAVYVYPTLSGLDPEKSRLPFKQKINLGLDLQGGLYMVLGVDFNKVFSDVVDRQAASMQGRLKDKGLPVTGVRTVREGLPADDPHLVVSYDAAKRDALHAVVKDEYWTLRLVGEKPGEMELGLSREFRAEVRDRTIGQSIEVIRNRIDEFGVAEPAISSQGTDRVVVELPGVKDVQRAKDLIGRTAKLEFKIADDAAMPPAQLMALIPELEKTAGITYKEGETKLSDYVKKLNDAAKGKIPEGREIAFERQDKLEGGGRIPYLLISKVDVSGEDLQDAQVTIDQEKNRPQVAFSLNPRGAEVFGKLTTESVGKRLAIVLDGIVHSAPVINGPIPGGHGVITLGRGNGDQVMKEAQDLSIVLRAGALPAQLEFLEQRVVGPSLGQDSIKRGALAGVVGCALVFLFMIFYYRLSGVVASISLMLNAMFVLAILVGMEATLTLPGIAGIALTIGMAVDSNVIIFERIRDELREGKSVAGAVEAGFQKAFSAIFDANITHGIIAVILMNFGTGPIRGFAVSLLIGIITTLFCAVTVCKLVFDGMIARKGGDLKSLSI